MWTNFNWTGEWCETQRTLFHLLGSQQKCRTRRMCVIAVRLCNNRIVCAEISKKSIQLKQIDFKWFPIDEWPNSCACVVWQLSLPSKFNVRVGSCVAVDWCTYPHFEIWTIFFPSNCWAASSIHQNHKSLYFHLLINWPCRRLVACDKWCDIATHFQQKKYCRVCSFRAFHTTDYWDGLVHFKVRSLLARRMESTISKSQKNF